MDIFESFNDYLINEKVDIKYKVKVLKWYVPLYEHYVEWCMKKFKLPKIDVKLTFKKTKNGMIGYMPYESFLDGTNEIFISEDAGGRIIFNYIAHELTHLKQMHTKELDFKTEKRRMVIWKGVEIMTVAAYSKMGQKDFMAYKKLPWEAEAYENEQQMPKMYLDSKEFKTFKDNVQEPNLRFILSQLI